MFAHILDFYMRRALLYRRAMRKLHPVPPRRHGHAGRSNGYQSRTYQTWCNIKARCENPKSTGYRLYGKRGIAVCERWSDFQNFLEDMGEKPPGKTLDRKNVNLGYSKNNCRWATPKQQNNNKRTNVYIEFNGLKLTRSQWAQRLGVSYQAIKYRLQKGWSIEKTLTTPFKVNPEA